MLVALTWLAGQPPAFAATESIDTGAVGIPNDRPLSNPMPGAIVGPEKPLARIPAGNPLWAIPLRVLTETRDRPLFSPSRRPPPAAVIAPAIAPVVARPAAPDHPLLTLVGTVVGDRQGIGIFLDQASKKIVRLRTGEGHDGWTLRTVHERDVVFESRRREATLALSAQSTNDRSIDSAATQARVPPSGTWMDGDGEMINPPPTLVNSRLSGASPRPAATWTDGDGQLITPPRHN